jgi:hypothetical protein
MLTETRSGVALKLRFRLSLINLLPPHHWHSASFKIGLASSVILSFTPDTPKPDHKVGRSSQFQGTPFEWPLEIRPSPNTKSKAVSAYTSCEKRQLSHRGFMVYTSILHKAAIHANWHIQQVGIYAYNKPSPYTARSRQWLIYQLQP